MDMHGLIKEGLEEYLRGTPGKKLPVEFEQHLRNCDECREELSWMQEQSRLLRALAASRELEPAAGFYARVMDRIDAERQSSFWGAFLEPAFGRWLTASALTLTLLLAGYLAKTETTRTVSTAPEAVMAVEDYPSRLGQDRQRDRDTMLVTLASYRD